MRLFPALLACLLGGQLSPVMAQQTVARPDCLPAGALVLGITLFEPSGHPLAGHVLSPALSPAAEATSRCSDAPGVLLVQSLQSASLVLLGEVHDNPRHHAAQARLIELMRDGARAGPLPVVMEMITTDFAPVLADLYRDAENHPPKTAALGEALRWNERGWPDWQIYAPIAEATHGAGGRLMAGDAPRERYRAIGREGEAAIPAEERTRLALDEPLGPALAADLAKDLKEGHCNLMPEHMMGRMALLQRYRDAHLADALLAAAGEFKGRAVLIAGNGHVRRDRAVPWYLARRAPDRKVVSVVLLEVEDGKTKPADYGLAGADGTPIADFVVFTPRQSRPDPCEELRKQFQPKGK